MYLNRSHRSKETVMSKEIRIPETTVQLVQILGTILRDHLKISFYGDRTECWTFKHIVNWQIRGDEPGPYASYDEWWNYMFYLNPEHEMSVYLGSGYCHAFSSEHRVKKMELRVRCEHSRWIATSLRAWNIQIWMKFEGKTVKRHQFRCHLGYGSDRRIYEEDASSIPMHPPKKIAFWRKPEPESVIS